MCSFTKQSETLGARNFIAPSPIASNARKIRFVPWRRPSTKRSPSSLAVIRCRIMAEVSRLAFSNIFQVLAVKDGELVVKDHADLRQDALSTVASIEEMVNDKGDTTGSLLSRAARAHLRHADQQSGNQRPRQWAGRS
jgi:hypothetical protein